MNMDRQSSALPLMQSGQSSAALAVFDLDGTLLRGATVCEVLADQLGHGARMREIEAIRERDDIIAARHEMAAWYEGLTQAELQAMSMRATLAADAIDAIAALRSANVTVAIASITWSFAVEAFARRLGIELFTATELRADRSISHVWAEDKAQFLGSMAARAGLQNSSVFAVGDTSGDVPMLNAAGQGYFVGRVFADGLNPVVRHIQGGSLSVIAADILERMRKQGV